MAGGRDDGGDLEANTARHGADCVGWGMKNEERGVEGGVEGGCRGFYIFGLGAAERSLALRLVAPGGMEVDVCAGSGRSLGGWRLAVGWLSSMPVGVWDTFLFVRCTLCGGRWQSWVKLLREKRAVAGEQKFEGARGVCVVTYPPQSSAVKSLLEGHLAVGTAIDTDTRPGWRLTSQFCRVECCQCRGRIQFPRQRAAMIWFHL